jgi:hypothetical protein
MKNFNKFLEEITIKGNPGVPGEGDRTPDDKSYLSDIERRAKNRLGVTGRENPGQIGGRLMQLLSQSQRMTRGRETELEKLATDIILSNYSDILDGVDLDIKLLRSGREVSEFMDEEEDENEEEVNYRDVTDPEIKRRIHKAKLGNTIIQGEAKNTKHILHTDEVKNGLRDIFGDQADEIFNIWDEMSKLADKMDWIIPIDIKADMMERAPEGMAGAVSVSWKPKEKEDKEEQEDKEDKEEIDMEEEDFEVESYTPTIKARGIDFPMLIHEAVKGIYELIAAVSQPGLDASEEEVKIGEIVKLNISSFQDEAEDFRTGPEIASDFRDFINSNTKALAYPNMRAFIFGMMMDPNYMSSEEFLKLFRGILNNSSSARRMIDEMIDEVIDKLSSYELDQSLPGYLNDDSDDSDLDTNYDNEDINLKDDSEDDLEDLSKLSQREIQNLIDDALDSGDYDEVKKLSIYLKEGKEIYLNELKRYDSFKKRIK